MSLDDLIERTVPADVYVPARVSLLKLLGKGEAEAELVARLLPRGGRAIDIGANKGTYVNHLVRHFDYVEAFEPIPSCAELLRRYAVTKDSRLTIHECALGSEVGSARLSVPERQSALFSSLATAYAKIDVRASAECAVGTRAIDVAVRRLDDFAFDDVRFIKIDVEGFEREVLIGAEATIARTRPLLLVEIEQRHLHASSVDDVVGHVIRWNYDAKFLVDGELRDFADFRLERDQLTTNGERAHGGTQRYINNFFFFPR